MRTILRENEETNLVVDKHWVVLLKPMALFLGSLLFLLAMLSTGFGKSFFWPIAGVSFFLGVNFWFKVKERRVDIWIVTTERIIDESGLFTLNVKETPLDKTNNIKYNQDMIGRMLGYGDIEIMSAADQGETINKHVSYPDELYKAVVTAQERYRQIISERDSNTQRTMGPDEKICPYCAEFVKKAAMICKHCHSNLNATAPVAASCIDRQPQDSPKPAEPYLSTKSTPIPERPATPSSTASAIPSRSQSLSQEQRPEPVKAQPPQSNRAGSSLEPQHKSGQIGEGEAPLQGSKDWFYKANESV